MRSMEPDAIIRVRFPSEQSYRNVKLIEPLYDGWWSAWRQSYGHLWSNQGIVHETWRKGQGPRVEQVTFGDGKESE